MGYRRALRRTEASAYLLEHYGISRTPATLAKLAVTGGGPPFRKVNRVPLYSPADLDWWVASIRSPKVRSNAELKLRLAQAASTYESEF